MAAPSYIQDTEFITAEHDALFPDVQNRPAKWIWDKFLVAHNAEGIHIIGYHLIDFGSFAGAAGAKTVALPTCTGMTIKLLMIWSANDGRAYFKTADMPTNSMIADNGVYTSTMGGLMLTTGGFAFTTSCAANTNGVTHYYLAIGTGAMPNATGDNLTPPTWVQHGDEIIGETGGHANQVEKEFWEDYFLTEHTDAGAQNTALWSGLAKFENGSFATDGTAAQIVNLDDATLNIKFLLLLQRSSLPPMIMTEDMTIPRLLNNVALTGTGQLSIDTGFFTLNNSELYEQDCIKILSDTTDGSVVFVDTSPLANIVTANNVCHSTTHPHTGATSIKMGVSAPYRGTLTVSFSALAPLKIPGDFTMSFSIWTDTTFVAGLVDLWFLTYTDGATGAQKTLRMAYYGTTGIIFLYNPDDPSIYLFYGSIAINDGAWHDIAIIRSGSTIQMTIDTTPDGSATLDDELYVLSSVWGNTYPWGLFTIGYLDDILLSRVTPLYDADASSEIYYIAIGT